MSDSEFDFIVVGAGPAGASLAARVAENGKNLKVLLVEAGGANADPSTRLLFDRYGTFVTSPDYNWNYMTTEQKYLDQRAVNYARGKGLGGSSAINFTCFTVGPKDEHDEWATLVGDSFFNWENARRRLSALETLHTPPAEAGQFVKMADWHGKNGPLQVGFSQQLETPIPRIMKTIADAGWKMNPDLNSGDPIGMSLSPATGYKGQRSTAASAFLEPPPKNLTVKTNSPVARVLFEGNRAVGIEVIGGQKYTASKEVILSAGALDSPKLLLLSGVGPEAELARHDIPVIHNLAGVGNNLSDHCHVFVAVELNDEVDTSPKIYADPALLGEARATFLRDGTGPASYVNHILPMGFFKDEAIFATPEFKDLPANVQEHFMRPTVPTYEFVSGFPAHLFFPGMDQTKTFLGAGTFLMGPQSRGTVTLASSNPSDAPVSDPNFFSHPFDRVQMIHSIRRTLEYMAIPSIAKDTVKPIMAPKSESDEDIWAYIKENLGSTWHMTGTCKMGVKGDPNTVVDTSFKVVGLEGLRVADMSVVPAVPSCHTVSWAYLTGLMAAERIINEYGLA